MKSPDRMLKEFIELHPILQLIICDINRWGIEHGEEPTWTCFMRTEEEQRELVDSGWAASSTSVHQFGRGADFRPFKDNNLNLLIEDYINTKYPYGDGKHKTLLFHEGTAYHGHVQVREG